jgi:microcystin-dependent protein
MTVNTVSNKITYIANGSTTVWTFPFPGVDPSFIEISITDSLGAVVVPPANQFTVTLNPTIDPNPTSIGGSVLYPIAGSPVPSGSVVSIVRTLPAVQATSIANQSIVYPPVIEQEFDYLTMLTQGGIEEFSRSFRVGAQDPIPALVPTVAQRKNTLAIFDADGNLTGGNAPSGVIISAVMIPVVTAPTLPIARTAMGVPPIDSPVFTGNPQAPTPTTSDSDTSVATTAFVQAAIAAAAFSTGDLKPTHKTVPDTGWIFWIDGNIGNASSNATIRANADTLALFTLYYNNYSDANCPLFTALGASTTRALQGTAATAFGAQIRVQLPRGSSRALGLAGVGQGLTARTLGSFVGVETHAITVAEMPSHSHGIVGTSDGQLHNLLVQLNDLLNMDFSGPHGVQEAVVQPTGGNQPMNLMNPTAYIAIMIKL